VVEPQIAKLFGLPLNVIVPILCSGAPAAGGNAEIVGLDIPLENMHV